MKKIISVILVLFLLCGSVYSSDAQQLNVAYDRVTGIVSVTGSINTTAQKVNLMVLRPNASVTELDAGNAGFFASAIHADETAVTQGAYTFDNFSVSAYLPGIYTVRVSDGKEVVSQEINVATEQQTLDLVQNAQTADEVLSCIQNYNDVYGLQIGTDSLFEKIGTAGQQETALRIANENPASKEALQESFDRNNLLYKIYLGPWTALGQLLSDNSTLLGIDMTALNRAYDATAVYKALTGTLFSGTSDLNTAYLTAISQNQAVIPGGGFVSGGGGGGGGAAYIPSVIPSTEDKTEINTTASFSDVTQNHWAFDSVETLYSKGIINGKGQNIFAPEAPVTRAEAVKMIVLTFALQEADTGVSFEDVTEADWSYRYISSAVSAKVVNGYSEKQFGKDDFVTRQDLAVMIYRAATAKNALESSEQKSDFADGDSISQYARQAVGVLSEAGIINGYNGMFLPSANATRAETAQMLAGFSMTR